MKKKKQSRAAPAVKANKVSNTLRAWAPSVLRLALGPLFIVPGIFKLMNPAGPTGMLQSMGFPAAMVFAWILLLSEIIFGAAVLIGFKVKYTVWPLVLIMLVATCAVVIPGALQNPMQWTNVIFHVLAIAGLVSLFLSGAGAGSVDQT